MKKKIFVVLILIILIGVLAAVGMIFLNKDKGNTKKEKDQNELALEKKETENEVLNKTENDNEIENNEPVQEQESKNTPIEIHGKLKVEGTDIVDENGEKFQLRGISTHGIAWFPQYVNQEAFTFMRENWGINVIRLAMYSSPNDGYNESLHQLVKDGVQYAKNAGLYVIIDWHILNDGNPNINKASAIKFFKEMAENYKDETNIIYEICNEPNGDVQ